MQVSSAAWPMSSSTRHRELGVEHIALAGDLVVLLVTYGALVVGFEMISADAPNMGFWCIGLAAAWLFVARWRPSDRNILARPLQSAYVAAQNTLFAGAIFFLLPLIGGANHSRISNLMAVVVLAAAAAAWRVAFARVVTVRTDDLVVVGAGWAGQALAEAIARRPRAGMQIVAFVDQDANFPLDTILGAPVYPISRLADVVHRPHGLARVVLAAGSDTQTAVFEQLVSLAECGVEMIPMSAVYEQATGCIPVRYLGSSWWAVLPRPNGDALYCFSKRALDVILSITGLVVLGVLLPVLWPLLRLQTGGSPFFRQVRVGRHGQPFMLYKLRTLPATAAHEAGWRERKAANHATRLCALLRAAGVDELPQMLNVLRGEMTLVGPRPYVPDEVIDLQQQIPFFRARALVRPGLTGWAQINYGYGLSLEDEVEKLQRDLYYMGHQSTYLDLLIMLRTLTLVIRGRRPASRVTLSALPHVELEWRAPTAGVRNQVPG